MSILEEEFFKEENEVGKSLVASFPHRESGLSNISSRLH